MACRCIELCGSATHLSAQWIDFESGKHREGKVAAVDALEGVQKAYLKDLHDVPVDQADMRNKLTVGIPELGFMDPIPLIGRFPYPPIGTFEISGERNPSCSAEPPAPQPLRELCTDAQPHTHCSHLTDECHTDTAVY